MPFLGVQPTDTFASVEKQTLTGDIFGTTVFTLDHGVSSSNDIALYINNVRQEPVTAYTASGNTLTLTESINNADDAYLIYIARTYQSVSMKGITDDTEDPIMTIDGSLTTGGDVVLNVGQNETNGYYVQNKNFGFEISNSGVGGNTAQIKTAGNVILSHNQIQDNLKLRTGDTDRVTILSGGNVGIGDTAPSALLSIRNGSSEGTVAEFYGSTDGKARALSITSGTVNNFSGAEWTFGIGSSGGEFVFENNAHATPSELVRITNGGQLQATTLKIPNSQSIKALQADGTEDNILYYSNLDQLFVGRDNTHVKLRTDGQIRLTVDSDGIKFNNDTAAANALDDYEEGVWSPSFTDGTNSATSYTAQTGRYIKVGSQVTVMFDVRVSNFGSVSGAVYIGNLPFNVNGYYWQGTLDMFGLASSLTAGHQCLQVLPNTDRVYVLHAAGLTGGHSVTNRNSFDSGSTIRGTITYETP